MARIGGSIEEMQQLKGTFDRESQTVQQLTQTIQGQVHGTWWEGPAADRFRSAWDSEFAPTLKQLQQALQEASAEVAQRAQALAQAGG